MTDITIRLAFRGQSVTVEPSTARGFAWAKEALRGSFTAGGGVYRLERAEAYGVLVGAESEGLRVDNRL